VQFNFPRLTPTIRTLLIVLVVVFVGQSIAEGLLHVPVSQWAALLPGVHIGLLWQWATYWLIEVPGAVLNFAIGLLFIYLMLSPLEERYGRTRILQLIAVGVIGGALPVMICGAILPSAFGGLAGASAIGAAGFGAFAVLSAGAMVSFMFLPPMSAWGILAIFIAISALNAMWAHDASELLSTLGGTGAGILYARWLLRPRSSKSPTPKKKQSGRPNLTVIEGGSDNTKPRWLN
jgi:membrane associated rhomboid family serine protease